VLTGPATGPLRLTKQPGDSADKCSRWPQLPVCVQQMYSNYCLLLLKRITVAKNRRPRTKFRVTSEGRYRISHASINFECFPPRTHTSARDLCANVNRCIFNLRSKKGVNKYFIFLRGVESVARMHRTNRSLIIDSRWGEVTGEWRKLHKQELNDLFCCPQFQYQYA